MHAPVTWTRKHINWTIKQWSNVAFTDEASFTVRPVKNRLTV